MATVSQRTITPKLAVEWLKVNTINRPIRKAWVEYLTDQIRADLWEVTTDAIGFDTFGRLVNGQHRLMACIAAGKPIEALVAHGVTPEAFKVTDRGIGRTVGDVLHVSQALVADAHIIFTAMRGARGRVSEHDIEDTLVWWRPAHDTLMKVAPTFKKGLSSGVLRVGFGLQWAIQPTQEKRQAILDQYRAFVTSDAPNMTKAVATLWKRNLQSKFGGGTREVRTQKAAMSFYFVSPERSDIEPIVRDPQGLVYDMREVLHGLEWSYIETPQDAAHPYEAYHYKTRPRFGFERQPPSKVKVAPAKKKLGSPKGAKTRKTAPEARA